ncbi:Pex19 protein family-domain-containing protein [Mycena sp. CBHHK59/15]|nr:Pex19 protein family-domain-containing protein [Mycena sp. CBHHK59/15]
MPPPAPLDTEDLDDLDDVLDQFATATPDAITSPPPPPPTATTTTTFTRPRTNTRVDAPPVSAPGGLGLIGVAEADDDTLATDFAAELAKGMESLMREIAPGPSNAGGGNADDAALKAASEAMLVEGMDGGVAKEPGPAPPVDDFQRKIQQAMGKLREGESTLKDAAAPGGPAPDSLEALLAQLNDLGAGADGDLPADDAELAGFLENMMGELMSKEVLHEPLTELADKFPAYLAAPPAPLPADDRERYTAQLERVHAILAVFDAPGYSDSDPKARETVVALMAEMQSFGSPPTELMGPLPPGLGALGEEGCVVC